MGVGQQLACIVAQKACIKYEGAMNVSLHWAVVIEISRVLSKTLNCSS